MAEIQNLWQTLEDEVKAASGGFDQIPDRVLIIADAYEDAGLWQAQYLRELSEIRFAPAYLLEDVAEAFGTEKRWGFCTGAYGEVMAGIPRHLPTDHPSWYYTPIRYWDKYPSHALVPTISKYTGAYQVFEATLPDSYDQAILMWSKLSQLSRDSLIRKANKMTLAQKWVHFTKEAIQGGYKLSPPA